MIENDDQIFKDELARIHQNIGVNSGSSNFESFEAVQDNYVLTPAKPKKQPKATKPKSNNKTPKRSSNSKKSPKSTPSSEKKSQDPFPIIQVPRRFINEPLSSSVHSSEFKFGLESNQSTVDIPPNIPPPKIEIPKQLITNPFKLSADNSSARSKSSKEITPKQIKISTVLAKEESNDFPSPKQSKSSRSQSEKSGNSQSNQEEHPTKTKSSSSSTEKKFSNNPTDKSSSSSRNKSSSYSRNKASESSNSKKIIPSAPSSVYIRLDNPESTIDNPQNEEQIPEDSESYEYITVPNDFNEDDLLNIIQEGIEERNKPNSTQKVNVSQEKSYEEFSTPTAQEEDNLGNEEYYLDENVEEEESNESYSSYTSSEKEPIHYYSYESEPNSMQSYHSKHHTHHKHAHKPMTKNSTNYFSASGRKLLKVKKYEKPIGPYGVHPEESPKDLIHNDFASRVVFSDDDEDDTVKEREIKENELLEENEEDDGEYLPEDEDEDEDDALSFFQPVDNILPTRRPPGFFTGGKYHQENVIDPQSLFPRRNAKRDNQSQEEQITSQISSQINNSYQSSKPNSQISNHSLKENSKLSNHSLKKNSKLSNHSLQNNSQISNHSIKENSKDNGSQLSKHSQIENNSSHSSKLNKSSQLSKSHSSQIKEHSSTRKSTGQNESSNHIDGIENISTVYSSSHESTNQNKSQLSHKSQISQSNDLKEKTGQLSPDSSLQDRFLSSSYYSSTSKKSEIKNQPNQNEVHQSDSDDWLNESAVQVSDHPDPRFIKKRDVHVTDSCIDSVVLSENDSDQNPTENEQQINSVKSDSQSTKSSTTQDTNSFTYEFEANYSTSSRPQKFIKRGNSQLSDSIIDSHSSPMSESKSHETDHLDNKHEEEHHSQMSNKSQHSQNSQLSHHSNLSNHSNLSHHSQLSKNSKASKKSQNSQNSQLSHHSQLSHNSKLSKSSQNSQISKNSQVSNHQNEEEEHHSHLSNSFKEKDHDSHVSFHPIEEEEHHSQIHKSDQKSIVSEIDFSLISASELQEGLKPLPEKPNQFTPLKQAQFSERDIENEFEIIDVQAYHDMKLREKLAKQEIQPTYQEQPEQPVNYTELMLPNVWDKSGSKTDNSTQILKSLLISESSSFDIPIKKQKPKEKVEVSSSSSGFLIDDVDSQNRHQKPQSKPAMNEEEHHSSLNHNERSNPDKINSSSSNSSLKRVKVRKVKVDDSISGSLEVDNSSSSMRRRKKVRKDSNSKSNELMSKSSFSVTSNSNVSFSGLKEELSHISQECQLSSDVGSAIESTSSSHHSKKVDRKDKSSSLSSLSDISLSKQSFNSESFEENATSGLNKSSTNKLTIPINSSEISGSLSEVNSDEKIDFDFEQKDNHSSGKHNLKDDISSDF